MIYYPYLTAADIGLTGTSSSVFVVDAGRPTANIVIVMKDFVQP